MGVKQLVITPMEAQVLELSLRGPMWEAHKDLLLYVGHCLVSNENEALPVNDDVLWLMREYINPLMMREGLDLIKKVYRLLLEEPPLWLDKESLSSNLTWSEKDDDKDRTEDSTPDDTEDDTRDRPSEEIES